MTKFFETRVHDGVEYLIYVDQCQFTGPGRSMLSVHSYWPDALGEGNSLFLTARCPNLSGEPDAILAEFPDDVFAQIVAQFQTTIEDVKAGRADPDHTSLHPVSHGGAETKH